MFDDVRMHERAGRPFGAVSFLEKLSAVTGRDLARKKAGRKRKSEK